MAIPKSIGIPKEQASPPISHIFYNDTAQNKTFTLGNQLYKDLDQNPISGSILLAPYTSQILIESGEAADLDVSMILLSSADTAPGEPLTYTITLRNDGILDADPSPWTTLIPAEIVDHQLAGEPRHGDIC